MKDFLSRFKLVIFIVNALLVVFIISGCGTGSNDKNDKKTENENEETSNDSTYPTDVDENPIVSITMDNDKEIMIELYPKIAPNTVANFISLIEEGFYDGLIFHRVIPEFMIQGGDPSGNGTGGPGYSIKGEFSSNGFDNDLKHDRGVISMARSQNPDSAGSQFFIMVKNSEHLDGEYAAFGQVVEGMKVVDEIVSAERDAADKPLEEQRMKTVKVDTKGYDYPQPEIQKK